ncbi:MAG: hypothetical protein JWR35_3510 [Marmoricola sp.]|nr:hypothetical protein [Marmoricola sp.]
MAETPQSPFDHLTRRAVLGGAGVGLLTGVLGGAWEAAEAATLHGKLPKQVDCVVVGGGISGLVAARHIRYHQQKSVLVLEARDRVGGRVLNHKLPNGSVIESGGAFIGPTQNHIAALAKQLGVQTFKEYNDGQSVSVSKGQRQLYTGTVPPDPAILLDAALVQLRIDQMAAELDVSQPWAHPNAKTWDSQTLGSWLRANTLNHDVVNLILAWTQPGFGADVDELSLLFVLWYVACSGDEKNKGTFERNSNTADGAQESRFIGGSQLIPLRMAATLHNKVALNAPVHRIAQRDGYCFVHSARGVVRAKRVIVACPPPMVLGIDWHPQLPAPRRTLLEQMPMGDLMKCDAVYKTPFWRKAGMNGFGISDAGAVRASFDNSPPDGKVGVLLAFVGGSTWRTYGTMSVANRRKHVLEGFAAMFGDEALHPIEYVEHNWPHEKWTGGAPVAFMGPNTLSTYGPWIRKPHGRVHWAGTETSTYWTGYMDGAVRAGHRAAAEAGLHL